MPTLESEFDPLRDPRLAARLGAYATSPSPAWLWNADGSRVLWTNAVGAAALGAATTHDCTARRFDPNDATAASILRLAATLPTGGQARLERLRGFAAGLGRALTCVCSRIVIEDTVMVLVAAAEPAGPTLTLSERVRRSFPDAENTLVAFAADGTLIYAAPAALARLAGATTLSALGLELLATQALTSGKASGTSSYGPVTLERLGAEASTVLILSFGMQRSEAAAAAEPEPANGWILPTTVTPEARVDAPLETAAVPASPAVAATTAASLVDVPPFTERRHPLRFVWQMDPDGRFVVGSDEFVELVGPRTTATFGRMWSEAAAELKLDPEDLVVRAVATRDTWSGITVLWPLDESSERLPVELSGLPVFDRERNFRGYRGFGVCRDIARINQLTRARRERPIGLVTSPEVPPESAPDAGAPAAASQNAPVASAELVSSPSNAEVAAAEPATTEPPLQRRMPRVAPAAANVVPFRSNAPSEPKAPGLSLVERKAFRELAQELTARLHGVREASVAESEADGAATEERIPTEAAEVAPPPPAPEATSAAVRQEAAPATANFLPVAARERTNESGARHGKADDAEQLRALEPVLLDRVPVGVLIHRQDSLLYANRHFLQLSGYQSLDALAAAGGLNTLFAEPGAHALTQSGGAQSLSIASPSGDRIPVEGRLLSVPWSGAAALALILTSREADECQRAAARGAESDVRELEAILEAAADGILVLDHHGAIVAVMGSAEALLRGTGGDLTGRSLAELFAPGSEQAVRENFDRVAQGVAPLHGAFDVTARVRENEFLPLSMTLTPIGADRFCAILRDRAPFKKIEDELRAAKREAEKMAAAKAEFLARVSHEIRTPLNAITGFAEIIMAERFGPISNERYREYLKDIHVAGAHLVSLLNDLLDLSKVESGQLDLKFVDVSLNELTQQCVGIMQPQASRARIIIRTSLAPGLPRVIADERSLRQIVFNLLSNSIRFTGPGGQVIVSTAFADSGEAVLRVRDTGVGMSEKDVEAALEPFRQTATSASWGSGGTGLGLPLTKALAEANRAHFSIKTAPNAGTLVEIAFPPTRVVAR